MWVVGWNNRGGMCGSEGRCRRIFPRPYHRNFSTNQHFAPHFTVNTFTSTVNMARRKNPQIFAAVLVATTVAAAGYKLYNLWQNQSIEEKKARKFNKSIALTLLHSVLASDLPLNDILLTSENVTFILPPHLSVDDLACNIKSGGDEVYLLPQTLIKNYKLLKCSNLQGYLHLVKSLKPDMLFVCVEDLGIKLPGEMGRFVKEIITMGQEEVPGVLSSVFMN